MRFASLQWIGAASVAVMLHSLLLLAWPDQTSGLTAQPPPGPVIDISDLAMSELGVTTEINSEQEELPEEITDDELLKEIQPDVEPLELAATAPIVPLKELNDRPDLPTLEVEEVKPVETRQIQPQTKKAKPKKKVKKKVERKRKKKAVKAKKRGKSKRRAAKRGNRRQGRTGRARRSGGGGRGRASAGQIASYRARVQSRIAACIRRRVGGRGGARVSVRFRVTSGGGASGVGVSGTARIRGAAASAARGCSFPRPPPGAPRSFRVSVTVR